MEIQLFNRDCLEAMKEIESESIDCILTDPPYKYLKNQKLERDFDEQIFFNEAKRVLKKDGFIVLFGRGTSFYRWNTILADMGFKFKEEIIWDKLMSSSPLLNVSRVHESISIFCKGNAGVNKSKIPYVEMKSHNIESIIDDVKRLKSVFKNANSLNAVLSFLENNNLLQNDGKQLSTTISGGSVKVQNRIAATVSIMENGMNEKSIIRTDFCKDWSDKDQGITKGLRSTKDASKEVTIMNSMAYGLNEKTIIKQVRDHYSAIHPTQKPVRLLERLLALVTKEGDTILDPFAGSASTLIACYNSGRRCMGFEIDKEYYEAGRERLKQHCAQGEFNYSSKTI